jgi:hypothetical protein
MCQCVALVEPSLSRFESVNARNGAFQALQCVLMEFVHL